MSQPILRNSTKVYPRKLTCLVKSRSYSSRASGWFTRFLSPSEEKKLYLGITSAFREKLVEQSNKSAKTYSHIIEHAILSTKPTPPKTGMLSISRIEEIKIELDSAGKAKDIDKLKQLENEMNQADLQTVTIYNRLIRAYLWNNDISLAENVLSKIEERGLVPTTRTITYLIQAYLKKNQLEEAKVLVEKMKDLSLSKLRTNFDCSIMFKYYEACGDTHAIEFLWRDIVKHIDTIRPGYGLFTQYLEYILPKQNIKTIHEVSKQFLLQQHDQVLTIHQYSAWIKAIQSLANTSQKENIQTSEQLLFYIITNAPPKSSWDKPKYAIQQIITYYLNQEQDLKAIAFYYRLRKLGVPNQTFDTETIQSIDVAVKQIEQNSTTSSNNKAMIAELEGLIFGKM